jgi:uncharacterized membrane protein required for colicin V production
MTIWILTVILLASLAGLGYRQGAIRVTCSLVGIIVAALVAVPLSPLIRPLFPILGTKHPLLVWVLPVFVVFVIVNSLFKVGAMALHRKADVHYKYKAGDLRLSLWERLNARLGFCLGLLNGAVYLVLLSFVIFTFGYWTVQLASSDDDPWTLRMFNRLARDLQSTGLARVAKAIDRMPESYYLAADVAGRVYHNPLVEGRLARYPGLIALGERSEFQQLGKDLSFTELRQRRASFNEVLNHSQAHAMWQNPDMLRLIWSTVQPDLKDLYDYLKTGKSETYSREKLLGFWSFDFNGAFAAYRKANPKISALQLRGVRQWMSGLFLNTTLVVGTDGFVVVKSLPRIKPPKPGEPPQAPEAQTLTGKWRATGGGYVLTFEDHGEKLELEAEVDGDRLTITGESLPLVFDRDV